MSVSATKELTIATVTKL